MTMVKRVVALVALVVVSIPVIAQQRPSPPATPRIYIFDNGRLTGLDPKMFWATTPQLYSWPVGIVKPIGDVTDGADWKPVVQRTR